MTWRRAGAGALTGVLLLLLLVPAALLLQQQSRTQALLLDRAEARLVALTELSARSIDTELASVQDVVGAWAEREELVQALSAGPARDGLGLAQILNGLRLANRSLDGAYAVSPSGRLLLAEPAEPALYGADFSSRDWYRGALRGPGVYVSEAFRAKSLDRPWALGVATAVRDPDSGRVVGVLGTLFRLDRVQQLVDEHLSSLQLQAQVYDQRGALIAGTGGLGAASTSAQRPLPPGLLALGSSAVLSGRAGGTSGVLWSAARLPSGGVVRLQVPQERVLAGLPERNRQVRLVLVGLCLLLLAAAGVALRLELGRRRSAAALREREDFLDAVLNSAEAGIAVCDVDGQLTWFNATSRERHGRDVEHGLTAAEWSERYRVTLLDGSPVPADQMPVVRVLHGEDRVDDWLYLLHGHDGPRSMRASARPLHHADGSLRGAVVVSHDVTDLLEQQERLRVQGAELARVQEGLAQANRDLQSKQAFLDAVLDHVDTGIVAAGPDGQLLLRNRMQETLFPLPVAAGGTGEQRTLLGADGLPVAVPEGLPTFRALRGEVLDREELRVRCADGRELLLEVSAARIHGRDGELVGPFAAAHDVTRLVQAEQAAREAGDLHRAVLAASPDLFFITDLLTGGFVYATDSSVAVLGYTPTELQDLGHDAAAALVHEDDVALLRTHDVQAAGLADGDVLSSRLRVRHRDGSWRWLSRRVTPFRRDEHGSVVQVLGVTRDVTAAVATEDKLQHAALHDALTGLPNRTLLTDRLTTALERASTSGREVAVLYLDLDGFKRVNDSAGHGAGDAVLLEVASRLATVVRPQDTVARLGGDEFVVLVEPWDRDDDPAEPPTTRTRASDRATAIGIADRIRAAVALPVVVAGREHVVTASTGLTFAAAEAVCADDVLRDADAAMYRAKEGGKDRTVVFEDHLLERVAEHVRVEEQLRRALTASTPLPGVLVPAPRRGTGGPVLSVAYQEILRPDGSLRGVEALARLVADDGTAVPPDLFVPVAEASGLVGALGARVLDAALAQLAVWRSSGVGQEDLVVSVNVSAHQAQDPALADAVLAALAGHGLPPEALELELTESVLLQAANSSRASLRRLHDEGVRIAIDDFGTGYASLRYLVELPVDTVKVDRSFTAGLPHDPVATTVVHAISGLAEDLGVACVVEGVETVEQQGALPVGVLQQGYLLGRPRAPQELLLAAAHLQD